MRKPKPKINNSTWAGLANEEPSTRKRSRGSIKVTLAQAWFTSSQLKSHFTGAVAELQSALKSMRDALDRDLEREDRGKALAGFTSLTGIIL